MLRCFIFKHGETEGFRNPYDLRNWLREELAGKQQGKYLLGGAPALLPDSVVLFARAGEDQRYSKIVGQARVKQAPRPRITVNRDTNGRLRIEEVKPGEAPLIRESKLSRHCERSEAISWSFQRLLRRYAPRNDTQIPGFIQQATREVSLLILYSRIKGRHI